MSKNTTLRVALAERQTTEPESRRYKILMSITGEAAEFAIRPSELRAIARTLVAQLEITSRPDWVIGFSPGGSPLAVAVADELDLPLLIAYRLRMPLPHPVMFTEPHVDHTFYVYGLTQGTVLLVDDEADSGNTLANAVMALRDCGLQVVDVAVGVEALHRGESRSRKRLADVGLTLKAVRTFEVDNQDEAFLRGSWTGGQTS